MPHISMPELPGILAPMAFRPNTAKALNFLAQTLLRGPSPLTEAERELIATYVSRKNNCTFCTNSHLAVTEELWPGPREEVSAIIANPETSQVSRKMKALLAIAAKVQQDGKNVKSEDINFAKESGASDTEIHDTVIIAAAFCMYNRYVDGLATHQPEGGSPIYKEVGILLKQKGYESSTTFPANL